MKKFNLLMFIACFIILISFIVLFTYFTQSPYYVKDVDELNDNWYIGETIDSNSIKVDIPGEMIDASVSSPWSISRLLDENTNDKSILFIADYSKTIALIDGIKIDEWGFEDTPFALPGRRMIIINLPHDCTDKTLTITQIKSMNLLIDNIYIGNADQLMAYALSVSLPSFVMGIAAFLMGVCLIILNFYNTKGKKVTSDFYFGIFAILTGILIPGRYYLVYLLLSPSQIMILYMLISYLVPISLMLYMLSISKKARIPITISLVVHSIGYLTTSLSIIFGLAINLYLLVVVQYIQLLYYIFIMIAVILEIKAQNTRFKRLKWGFFILMVAFLFDNLNIQIILPLPLNDRDFFFIAGLLAFVLIEGIGRINDFNKHITKEKSELEASKLKTKSLVESLGQANTYNEKLKYIKHDINNHLNILYQLIEDNKIEKSEKYICELIDNYHLDKSFIICENKLVNALILRQIAIAEKSNIDFTYSANIQDNITISDTDLCSLFSNILDNAFEAAANVAQGFVTLEIKQKNRFIYISCTNSKLNIISEKDGNLVSTKNNKQHQGLGTKIIKSITEKYYGVLEIAYDSDTFQIEIALKAINCL